MTVAVALATLALISAAALLVVPLILKGSNSAIREVVFKAAGAVVVLLGSYFAARTLKQTRSDQRASRILQPLALLAGASQIAQVGAVWALADIAQSSEGSREIEQTTLIRKVLEAARENPREDGVFVRDAASAALEALGRPAADKVR